AVAGDLSHRDGMETERVRPVGRSSRKDPGESASPVAPWIDLEHSAPRTMEPGDDDEFVARDDAVQSLECPRLDVQPGIGRSFPPLPGRTGSFLQLRMDHPDGSQPKEG